MIDVLKMMAETRKEAREEMRVMLEMMRPAQQAPDATEKVFSLVEKLAPLISQGGGDGGGNPWLFALSQLKDPIMKAIDTIHIAVTKGPAPGPVVRPLAVDKTQVASQPTIQTTPEPQPNSAPAEPQPQPTEGDMIANSFKEYLPMFCKAASLDKDPALYCDIVLDQVPVFGYDRLRTWLLKPGCLDDLAQFAPIISADPQQRRWWEALRGLIVGAITEELGDAPSDLQPLPHSDASTTGPADSA
jgi:hypothetical protein